MIGEEEFIEYLSVSESLQKKVDQKEFVKESNKIEGIMRDPSKEELSEFDRFIRLKEVSVEALIQFVKVYQPDARLRDTPSVPGVRVGSHIAPPSGPEIRVQLEGLLKQVNSKEISPFDAHVYYETLHPFTDGNGRSGRALWAWMMQRFPLGFLHKFYYQTLANSNLRDKHE